ncbi:MAG: type II toxin-antitoxin system PemK/MazF family toxin [Candidatus Thermoplasmatota archaeon]|nr:type II toxin-antitoxin system PemK/MazF family toxin [Candidatus Thermoplasmatota archaeon]
MLRSGDVIIAKIQFTDTYEIKKRPALILFEEFDNVVVAGITSNLKMKGIPLSKQEGAVKDSVIKMNYIFTISRAMIFKTLFHLNKKKKQMVFDELSEKLSNLKRWD